MPTHRNHAHVRRHTATDTELLDELDQLVADATAGNAHAVGAIAIAFGPLLLQEIHGALGALYRQDAGEVLQQFLLSLTEARLVMPPIRGGALPWMKRTVRSMAREHLRQRSGDWGEAG
jgi:hypothetical protein